MTEYIERENAVTIADYAVDEHPYDKNPEKPETFSEYNEGWNDACDYIREQLENAEKADVIPVAMLEKWLWAIAINNFDNYLSYSCEEIIRRLPGLKKFAEECGGADNGE